MWILYLYGLDFLIEDDFLQKNMEEIVIGQLSRQNVVDDLLETGGGF